MNPLEALARAEAVIDLLRVNLAADFMAALPANGGSDPVEARQASGVAACELAGDLIHSARNEIARHLADAAANDIAAAAKPQPAEKVPPGRRGPRNRHPASIHD
ncbi:MAG: hypothetical protein JNK22_04025 [Rhodocyclaceae bacterium]|nr:hypothetical protein [Rhodocyclaceae bacterium]